MTLQRMCGQKSQVFEVTEVMRQKDNSWCQLLRRLRVGELLPEDYTQLNNLPKRPFPPGTPQVCRLNVKVKALNEKVLAEHTGDEFSIETIDCLKGEFNRSNIVTTEALKAAETMTEDSWFTFKFKGFCGFAVYCYN